MSEYLDADMNGPLTEGCVRSVLHLTLFVFACIDTKKWRSAAKRAKSERDNIELQYHRSPEEHQAHQPPAYTPSAEGSGVMADSAVKYS